MTQTEVAPAAVNPWAAEDVGNLVEMEHVNTSIPDQVPATVFYVMGLGFTRDPFMNVGITNMWVNIGQQQLHMPSRGVQVLPGHVGVVVPDLQGLASRLESVREMLAGTKFDYAVKSDHVVAVSPWGNEFRCYAPNPRFGDIQIGIAYVEVRTRRGTSPGIVRFYQQIMEAPARVEQDEQGASAHVTIGIRQELIFRESDEEIPPYDKHHIAVYVANFSGPLNWLNERGLVTEGVRNHQFRFQDIVDPDSGELLHTLEHEVRGLHHRMYHRDMVNRNADQNMAAYSRGGDALSTF
jgi:hypothetical protein